MRTALTPVTGGAVRARLGDAGARIAQLIRDVMISGDFPPVQKLWNTTGVYGRAYVRRWNIDPQRVANEEHHLRLASLRDDEIAFKNGNAARRRRNPSQRGNP